MKTVYHYLQYALLPFIFVMVFMTGVVEAFVDAVDEARRDVANHKKEWRQRSKL